MKQTLPPGFRARAAASACILVAAGVLAGCSASDAKNTDTALLLSGPNTNIVVSIPAGWHQVIDSTSPLIPEMVAPTTCMGSHEVTCALGMARMATITAKTISEAEHIVTESVINQPGVIDVTTISDGPAKVGKRDGYRHRFSFRNPAAALTTEIAAVPSGPTTPDKDGNLEYSVIMMWVSDQPDAPHKEVIDQIVNSALVHGGVPPH